VDGAGTGPKNRIREKREELAEVSCGGGDCAEVLCRRGCI